MRRLGIVLLMTVLLAGCGEQTSRISGGGGGDIPITQRAIAAVALEHAPTDTTSRVATYTDREDPHGALGADLRYDGGGESDGGLLRVFVSPQRRAVSCDEYQLPGCETREVAGGTMVLTWDLEEPEEDPGYVSVAMVRPHETVSASWFGDAITGDPRSQDLRIPVTTLEAIVQDPRVGLTTSAAVIEAGRDLDDWGGEEPDPQAYDRVPSTDTTVAWSYWLTRGGYNDYSGLRPSPLKAEFGPGALGGQFQQENGDGPDDTATIDVLASPQRPDWMSSDVCTTPRFAGHCVRVLDATGEKYLAWVPGPADQGGEIWAIGDRPEEVVAVRFTGVDVPASRGAVVEASEWPLVKELLDDRRLGLQTDKEVLDSQF